MTSLDTPTDDPGFDGGFVDVDESEDYLDSDVPPPRERAMTRFTWVVLFLLTLGAGFWGGAWAKDHNSSNSSGGGGGNAAALAAFAAARGGAAGGAGGAAGTATTVAGAAAPGVAAGGTGAAGAGGAAARGGATFGTVKLVDHGNVYIQNAAGDVVKVATDGTTTISVTKQGTVDDLKPGATVVVQGATGADGTVTATSITDAGGLAGAAAAFGGGAGGAAGGTGGAGRRGAGTGGAGRATATSAP